MRRRVLVYGEVDPNLVDGSSVWLQSICQVLASIDGVEVTLLLRRPLEPGRRYLLAELEASHGVDVVSAGRSGLLAPEEALDLLEDLDRERGPFDVVLLRGQAVLSEVAHRDSFDGRLWPYAMTGRGMPDETLRALASRSARLLCQTEAVAAELRQIAAEADGSILVLPPMIPGSAPPFQREDDRGHLRLAYSGKLAPDYCWLETVEAFRALRERRPRAELHVLGDKIQRPPDRPAFHEAAIRSLRETEGLRWHGAVPRAVVPRLLAECDLALSIRDPNVEAAREISTKVLEYGAAGLAVVLNRAPAYERLLGTGYPLFVDAPQEAAALLVGPALDPEVRAAAAAACRAASGEFTFARVAAGLADELPRASRGAGVKSGRGVSTGAMGESAAPPLLVVTRFGIGVRDPAWLDHRVALISAITAPSLLAQDDQSFHWAVFVDADLPAEVRSALEATLAPFDGRAFLYSEGRFGTASTLALAQRLGAVAAGERVLTGRIDDDDAWNTKVVGMVRDRASRWIRSRRRAPGVGITFEHGFEWIMYDMLDVDAMQKSGREVQHRATVRPFVLPFLATSVFILAQLSSRVSTLSAGHSRMAAWLEEKGYDVDVISTDRPMWLYCRHKQAGSGIQKSTSENIDVNVAELVEEFGLDRARTTRYLAGADGYGYGTLKRPLKQRADLQNELKAVSRRVGDPATSDAEKVELRLREAELRAAMAQMAENFVGDLQ